ncbi:efflux RND transporter permease subunit [Pseudobacteriovorax antillogorgiicola]|uniref:Multidrug efflux pump subunit AcrB n=1 Tax=Pseudobacteriovorax antillogorgiicola TaxID=1513793 RepID=A0A1Y6BKG1_9BACT|nr:efflux RND transporter permease subunit [Pseudobacteriovorax antillogorgiicola]TCS56254.1 multidrug efflux pump subunit AcrB [Pseudobacteriovorax antillogorgiicola]SMF07956.1 Multidrug efflux pump subunit AcrB [Pseudobacteriovorax antillogorgiicola]
MNKLIDYFAKQGIFVDLITVFVFVAGVVSILSIKREVFPNISFDIITVVTPYPGASAESSERLLTNPLEQDLKEVDGIKKMTSISREGGSTIILQLDPDQTTADDAKEDIQEVVDAFTELPEDAEDPIVTVLENKTTPAIEIALSGNVSEDVLRSTAKFLEEELELLSDVAKIQFNGLRDYEVRVEAVPSKLRQYQVSLTDITNALARRNISTPGGTIDGSEETEFKEMIVRTIGEFEDASEVDETVIRTNVFADPIRIKDVAKVTTVFERVTRTYRTNGTGSISLTVLKKESGDVLDLVAEVKQRVEELMPQIDPSVQISYVNDTSFYVQRRISVLSNNLLVGLGLVLVVLSLILPWRVAAITAFGIPFSFLGAIAIFFGYDISINLISMMGLIIVVGMLVDDAVVVTENAQRFREKGFDPMEAAVKGTQQVWAPVTVSVLTTVMAFAPMLYMSGIFGKFIRYIPMGVIIALLISLWECFFVLPHHLGKWIRKEKSSDKSGHAKGGVFVQTWEAYVQPFYSYVIYYVIKLRYLVILATVLFLGGSLFVAATKMDFVLFPKGGVETFIVNFETPNGTSLAKTTEVAEPIEKAIAETLPDSVLDDFIVRIGIQQKDANDPSSKVGTQYGQAFVYLTPATERDITAQQAIDMLREAVGKPAGVTKLSFEQISGGPPVGKPVNIGVRGKTYEAILPVVSKIQERLKEVEGVSDIESSYYLGKKEFHVRVKDAEAVAAGLTVFDIGRAVRASFEGLVPTTIRRLDEELDIRVTLTAEDRSRVETIDQILVPNVRSQLIPLGRVATIEETQGVSVFRHEANQRQVSVLAELDTAVSNSREVNAKMQPIVADILKDHPGIRANFGGENEDTNESMASLARAFGFAFFGILLILILLFKNLYQPMVIAATIPLGVVAVIWTFFFHGKPLSFLGMIGVIALAGVIVNNAIVLVDFVNQLVAEGVDRFSAVRQAARIRLRPIFLTTVTTTAGILPTAYGLGGLDPFVVPIALALGWGMTFGAFLTTLLLPALLVVTDDIREGVRKIFSGGLKSESSV